jgi:hypothetical protein
MMPNIVVERLTLLLRIWDSTVLILARRPIRTEVIRGFPQSLQTILGQYLKIRPRSFRYAFQSIIHLSYYLFMSWGSAVSIEPDYRLHYRAIGVRSPAEAKDFSCSLCIQTSSEAHQASYILGTGGPFPRGKARPGCNADHSPQSSAVMNDKTLYSFPPCRLHGDRGQL